MRADDTSRVQLGIYARNKKLVHPSAGRGLRKHSCAVRKEPQVRTLHPLDCAGTHLRSYAPWIAIVKTGQMHCMAFKPFKVNNFCPFSFFVMNDQSIIVI